MNKSELIPEKPELSELQNELEHYGVLGMKWGVRKDPSKAYRKSSQKAHKLQSASTRYDWRSTKYETRSDRQELRSMRAEAFAFGQRGEERAKKYHRRALRFKLKSSKYKRKAAKTRMKLNSWIRLMSREFAKVKISDIKKEDLDYGKEYAYMLLGKEEG